MRFDFLATFDKVLRGRSCRLERREFDWVFDFGHGCVMAVSSPWRIVQNDRIAHADTDDGQQFGLPAPVDGEARTNKLFAGRCVTHASVDPLTADVRVQFDGDVRLDVFNHSSGYEGWQAQLPFEGKAISIIGLGGGNVAIVDAG